MRAPIGQTIHHPGGDLLTIIPVLRNSLCAPILQSGDKRSEWSLISKLVFHDTRQGRAKASKWQSRFVCLMSARQLRSSQHHVTNSWSLRCASLLHNRWELRGVYKHFSNASQTYVKRAHRQQHQTTLLKTRLNSTVNTTTKETNNFTDAFTISRTVFSVLV